jgi:hypothetical protein
MIVTRRESLKTATAGLFYLASGMGNTALAEVAGITMPRKSHRQIKAHDQAINAVAFSPDGKTLASGADDGTVRIWNLGTGNETLVLKANPRAIPAKTVAVLSLAFSPDGKTLACGAKNDWVRMWDLETGHTSADLNLSGKANRRVTCVAFSPDGKKLATGSALSSRGPLPCEVTSWDLSTAQQVWTLQGSSFAHPSVAFIPPKGDLAALTLGGGADRGIILVSSRTGRKLASLVSPDRFLATRIAISPSGLHLASVEFALTSQPVKVPFYQIALWKTSTLKAIANLDPQTEEISSLAFSPLGEELASCDRSLNGLVNLWDVTTLRKRNVFSAISSGPPNCLAFSPDGTMIAAGHTDGVLHLWRIA